MTRPPVTSEQKFLSALVTPLRDLETLWHQMRMMRDPRTSVGVHLELLGKIVGRRREGITDDELYRRLVFAQVSVNRSTGTIDELLLIAELVVFDDAADYIIDYSGNASLVFRVEGVSLDWTLAQTLLKLLRKAVFGGVRLILEWFPAGVDETNAFQFDGDSDDTAFPDTGGAGGGMFIDGME